MDKEQLIANLKFLASITEKHNPAISGVLCCITGAIIGGKELELLKHLAPFNQQQINEINNLKAQQN